MTEKRTKSPGRPRASEQTQSTRNLVLTKAIKLFLDHGYPVVSVDDIAKDCNVTKATVYYYFSSKTNLFTAAMVQMMEQINDQIEILLQTPGTLKERFMRITKAHLQATYQINIDTFMQGTKSALTTEQTEQILKAEENMYKTIETALTNAIKTNEIPTVNPIFATQCYLALLQVGNYKDKHNNPVFTTIDDMANHIVTFFWNGLLEND